MVSLGILRWLLNFVMQHATGTQRLGFSAMARPLLSWLVSWWLFQQGADWDESLAKAGSGHSSSSSNLDSVKPWQRWEQVTKSEEPGNKSHMHFPI